MDVYYCHCYYYHYYLTFPSTSHSDCLSYISLDTACMACRLALRLWLAQMASDTPSSRNRSVGALKYLVGTITTGVWQRTLGNTQNNVTKLWRV